MNLKCSNCNGYRQIIPLTNSTLCSYCYDERIAYLIGKNDSSLNISTLIKLVEELQKCPSPISKGDCEYKNLISFIEKIKKGEKIYHTWKLSIPRKRVDLRKYGPKDRGVADHRPGKSKSGFSNRCHGKN